MYSKLLYKYDSITKEIESEKRRNSDKGMLLHTPHILSKGKNNENEYLLRKEKYKIAIFSLLCMRIALNCQLILNGYDKNQKQLLRDIFDAVEYAKAIENKTDNAVIFDTLDIITAVCPLCEKFIMSNMLKNFPFIAYQNNIFIFTSELYFLFNFVVDYWEEKKEYKLCCGILEYLYTISRKRNNIDIHREVIVGILRRIVEKAPEIACKIGNADAFKFENIIDKYSGDFFWFYAYSLSKTGNTADAGKFFKKCYNIRKAIYGENNWFTAIAKREYGVALISSSEYKRGCEILFNFADNIESGLYEETDKNILSIIEGKTLYLPLTILMEKNDIDDLKKYNFYLKIYEKICAEYNNNMTEPLLKLRLAGNLRASYYFITGNYIQAEMAFIEALNAKAPKETSTVISVSQIKINLLMAYFAQNDLGKALPLMIELLALLYGGKRVSDLSLKDECRIHTLIISMQLQSFIDLDNEYAENLKEMIYEVCQKILEDTSSLREYAAEGAVLLIYSVMLLLRNGCASKNEQEIYLNTLCKIEKESLVFKLNNQQNTLFYLTSSFLAWNLNSFKSEYYIKKSIEKSEKSNTPVSVKILILRTAAAYYGKKQKNDIKIFYLEKALNGLTKIWRSYVKYLNDTRLIEAVFPMQTLFLDCYAILRHDDNIAFVYEKLMQFKELASLAGKERNRVIYSGHIDGKLLSRIQAVQDRIAALETESAFRNISKEYEKEEKTLRYLETEFARKFPHNVSFTDITWEKVKNAVPDNTAVIEYFFSAADYGKGQFEPLTNNSLDCMDIFIIFNKNNKCELKRLTVCDGGKILEAADEFVMILQAESNMSANIEQMDKKDELRAFLYTALIKPINQFIGEAKTLYIAPDSGLINLPFEILYDDSTEQLLNNYDIIKIECARDFLFNCSGYTANKGTLIIGNPKYNVKEKELGKNRKENKDNERAFHIEAGHIHHLPFSELEIRKIGKHSKSPYFSGLKASKNIFLSANGYKNIHIATHGYFDLYSETKSIYSSCLMFAGVDNWIKTGRISEVYGNGIVTADEVSRMNLHSVELVVLSSCLNGMNELSVSKGFYGMIGALSAAGVKYVISHLWSANDFATAIFMDEFYCQYIKNEYSPSAALRKAKNYLKNITIAQIRAKGWFEYVNQGDFDKQTKEIIYKYENCSDRLKPFKSEAYWGGFICCQCN